MTYDAIVVGLGPAGATAAYELAKKGHRVLALEKAILPRYKPCGGIISSRIDRVLERDFIQVIEKVVYAVEVNFKGGGRISYRSESPLAYLVARESFDLHLANKAEKAGAKLITGQRVIRVEERKDALAVSTNKNTFVGRYLIGADGVHGVVGKALGFATNSNLADVIVVEGRGGPGLMEAVGDAVQFDLGYIPCGYSWLFPREARLVFGLGGLTNGKCALGSYYQQLLERRPLLKEVVAHRRAVYRLPVFPGGRPKVAHHRCLLVGDAAALVDPVIYEGIYYAALSGRLAARAIHQGLEEGVSPRRLYQRMVNQEICKELKAAKGLAFFLYHFPWQVSLILKNRPEFMEEFLNIFLGKSSYRQLWRKFRSAVGSRLIQAFPALDRLASDYAQQSRARGRDTADKEVILQIASRR